MYLNALDESVYRSGVYLSHTDVKLGTKQSCPELLNPFTLYILWNNIAEVASLPAVSLY